MTTIEAMDNITRTFRLDDGSTIHMQVDRDDGTDIHRFMLDVDNLQLSTGADELTTAKFALCALKGEAQHIVREHGHIQPNVTANWTAMKLYLNQMYKRKITAHDLFNRDASGTGTRRIFTDSERRIIELFKALTGEVGTCPADCPVCKAKRFCRWGSEQISRSLSKMFAVEKLDLRLQEIVKRQLNILDRGETTAELCERVLTLEDSLSHDRTPVGASVSLLNHQRRNTGTRGRYNPVRGNRGQSTRNRRHQDEDTYRPRTKTYAVQDEGTYHVQFCNKCRNWGFHTRTECRMTRDECYVVGSEKRKPPRKDVFDKYFRGRKFGEGSQRPRVNQLFAQDAEDDLDFGALAIEDDEDTDFP